MSDKYKDTKKYLNRAYKCTRKKEMLEREYKQKQREVGNISVCYDEIKTNNINSKVEDKALELIRLKNYVDLHNIEIDRLRKEIESVIDKVDDDTLKTLLRLRYLEFKKWKDVSYILGYSDKYIFKPYNKALTEVDKYINA
ncbi:MAG: DUF1492 domain-containing protein [Clostridiales bacterium]|nr:DUF1492 domain-containing protein [Clostridiales bacterium]DAM85364.1 MAG TPA: Protein of unknown function (DUF1492) [Caudoviricetes sp.]